MNRLLLHFLFSLLVLVYCSVEAAQPKTPRKLDLQHADLLEVILSGQDTTVATGSVSFQTENGTILCDSAVWVKGRRAKLIGSVIVEDTTYRLIADTVNYDLKTGVAIATGPYVELYSRSDSLFAVGTYAYYDRVGKFFRMNRRPTLYLNYPDSARMIEVVADSFDYAADDSLARAIGNVVITSEKVSASARRAEMNPKGNQLDLYDGPVLKRGESTVSGKTINILTQNDVLDRIIVTDSARAEFREPVPSKLEPEFDHSILTGKRITFAFDHGEARTITSTGQAYSWYYPATRGSNETNENAVSGDSITFHLKFEKLQDVIVIGGATGAYINSKVKQEDTVTTTTRDTVNYTSHYISYNTKDSSITLLTGSHVTSGTVELRAHRVIFDTQRRIIRAYSANVVTDSTRQDTTLTGKLQPNPIPVMLKDKQEEIFGDFLEYSIDTQKGRIVQSKSAYQTGFYYGEDVYRAQKDVFYVENGRYTTCDADEPHFHFYSKHMKLVENDKLIAKPVVLNIGRLPILALPYYVFPLKKGRHSGILPFRIGNLQQGNRYVENLGYFWAPSDRWDVQTSLGYYDGRDAVSLASQVRYKQIYVYDGNISGKLTKETSYNPSVASETKSTRYLLQGGHSHQFSPNFKLSGTGQYVSDRSYLRDYSANLPERLNSDNILGRINFDKRFSPNFSIAGAFSHTVYLDKGNRIDQLENTGVRFPTIRPFGSGKLNDEGVLQSKWYNDITFVPSVRFNYYSDRIIQRRFISGVDTTYFDTLPVITPFVDTLSKRVHKRYGSASTSFPLSQTIHAFKYLNLTPSVSYSESWVWVFKTDITDSLNLKPDLYRSYIYQAGVGASTTLYGTVNPNIFGLKGLRQSLTPRIGYTYLPKLFKNQKVQAYTGQGVGSAAQSQRIDLGLEQLYQAKVKAGEADRTLNLFSITSSTSYDFENTTRPWSNLVTSIRSSVLPKISLNGTMVHDLYKPGTNELAFWSPALNSFQIDASLSLGGKRFLFDEVENTPALPKGADSANQIPSTTHPTAHLNQVGQGWRMSASYSYSESGKGDKFVKASQIQLNLSFNLSSTTTLSYFQYYDIARGQTVNRQINITKNLHCWTGQIYWVPNGSNRGFGFQLFVTAIPAIKLDNSQTGSIAGSLMENIQ